MAKIESVQHVQRPSGKYRKKPIEVYAEEFWPEFDENGAPKQSSIPVGVQWYMGEPNGWRYFFHSRKDGYELQGSTEIFPGDMIIDAGENGGRYSCPREVFKKIYDPVDPREKHLD